MLALTRLATAMALLLLTAPLGVEAQESGKVYRVGRLAVSAETEGIEAFARGLRELGWGGKP